MKTLFFWISWLPILYMLGITLRALVCQYKFDQEWTLWGYNWYGHMAFAITGGMLIAIIDVML